MAESQPTTSSQEKSQERHVKFKRFSVLSLGKRKSLTLSTDSSCIEIGLSHDFGDILDWEVPDWLSEYFEYEICGRTVDGCPILTLQFGQWDFRRVKTSSDKLDWDKYIDLMYARLDEKMRLNSESKGIRVNQFVAVIDFGGFGMKQMMSYNAMSSIRAMARTVETRFRGACKACFVVNSSVLFKTLCAMLRLSSRTTNSLIVFGTNQNEWKEALLKEIPKDQLPFRLGGTLVPAGTSVVDYKHLIYGRRYSLFVDASLDQDKP